MPTKSVWPVAAPWPSRKRKSNSSRRWRWRTTNTRASIDLPMRSLIGLMGILVVAPPLHVEAATLNKCIDAKGQVTYSNLPCSNAREVRTVVIDPAPPPEPVHALPAPIRAKPAKPDAAASHHEPATLKLETRRIPDKPAARASTRQCDTLTDKLGQVSDKMDQAHRKGYTQKQMDAWNQEVKDLERKKQQAGCF